MSNNDSIDDETKRILAEVDADDSKESIPNKSERKKITGEITDDGIQWETNTEESPDSEW